MLFTFTFTFCHCFSFKLSYDYKDCSEVWVYVTGIGNGFHLKWNKMWGNLPAKVTQSFTGIRKINARLKTKN